MKTAHMKKPAALVINAETPNGYGVIVNLGRMGVKVYSLDSNPKTVTFLSKYAKRILTPDIRDSEEAYIRFLINIGKKLDPKPVLFITGDEMLLSLLKYKDRLEQYFHMPMAELQIVEKLAEKPLFYKMLDHYGVAYADTFYPQTAEEVKKKEPSLSYPYIIKPVHSGNFVNRFHNKCLRADSGDELVRIYELASETEDTLIVQQELKGTERYLVYMYFDRNSNLLAACCYKKLRITPIDYGNACACETMWDQEIVDIGVNLLKKIGYHGLAEAEVQRDKRDGKLKLVEINARSTTENRLTAKCGMNMEYIAYCDVLGVPIEPIKAAELGVTWIEILRDIRAVFSKEGYIAAGQMTFSQWLKSLKGKKEYAFWALDDPLPFIVLSARFFKVYGFKTQNFSTVLRMFKNLWSKF